ncbi:hypothetical protein [Nocardioides acrostichi]|uniref:Uncharacterized protein n=1 Tax=Nocardioides acrostichi TaxID=2784339 RepID=A0A930UYJ0_9ACTN|nr:hypothetical protein [Nocardioides acrostichi]MBF4160606.1 hypothetical protein [Nocardioides acrostichi]
MNDAPTPPVTLRLSLRLLGGLVLLGLVTVVLTRVLRNDLVLNWAMGHESAAEVVQRQGLAYLIREQPIAVPQFFPVAATLFVVMACLIGVLGVFFAHGHHWARVCLTALLLAAAVATGSGLAVHPPATFEALSYLALAVVLGILVTMWHPLTSRFLKAMRARVSSGAIA